MARPFIPVPNVWKVELRYLVHGQLCENVMNCHAVGDNTTEMMNLGALIVDWFDTYMKSNMHTSSSLESVKITSLTSKTAPVLIYNVGLPIAGQDSAGTTPNNVSVAIKLSTQQRGRNSTGRLYQLAIPSQHIDHNNIKSDWQATIKTAYETLLSILETAGYAWQVVSYVTNKTLRGTGVANAVQAISIDPILDSQRRRLPGRGR